MDVQKLCVVFVIWMTGYPCSGKSTLAEKLLEYIPKMKMLDGDEMVKELELDDWTKKSRIKHSEKVAYLAKSFLERDISVCVAKISPYEEMRTTAKNILGKYRFIELFVKCSLEVCANRDVKGMYKRAKNDELDNFSGVTAPYEMPNNSDLIIDTENSSIEDCTINILNFLKSNNLISTSIEIAKK